MAQWIVVIPLDAAKRSDPEVNLFIEPGNVLDGIQFPDAPVTSADLPIPFTYNGEEYSCERLDLETCARPKA
jgi:hypothetical protein